MGPEFILPLNQAPLGTYMHMCPPK